MTRSLSILAIGFEISMGLASGAERVGGTALENLISRTAQRVEQFWDKLSAVTCLESVEQQKLSDDGKVLLKKRSTYDYLVLLQLTGSELMVDESRVLQGKANKENDRPLLSTSGFSTLLLIFHPLFRESYTFSDDGDDPRSPMIHRVRFEHVSGQRSPSVLQLRSREFPLEWKGTAWIRVDTADVTRIEASLKTPLDDIGLKRLESEVRYAPVSLNGEKDLPWMPMIARIEADTKHQHWRNLHEFTGYKQFNVSTESKTENPKEVARQ
jgi:hypothetical protein